MYPAGIVAIVIMTPVNLFLVFMDNFNITDAHHDKLLGDSFLLVYGILVILFFITMRIPFGSSLSLTDWLRVPIMYFFTLSLLALIVAVIAIVIFLVTVG
jgi:hypothetical protein